jgi:hypothetical protein
VEYNREREFRRGKQKVIRHSSVILIFLFLPLIYCGPDKPEQATIDEQLTIERWPEEGVPVIAWTGAAGSLPLYSQPGDERPEKYLAVRDQQRLSWDKSLMVVNKFGKLKILENCIITGYVYDSFEDNKLTVGKARELNFSSGTILDVVCYAAEGYYIFRHLDKYIEMGSSHEYQQMLSLPQTEWWVRIEKDKKPVGWVRVDEDKVSVVDRRF